MGTGSGVLRGVGLAVLLSASGCYAHVQLQAPPPSAPLQARVKAYNALKATSYSLVETRDQYGILLRRQPNLLNLADGKEVHYPEDLLPVVAPDSACALAVKRYLPAVRTAHMLSAVGYTVAFGAGAWMLASLGNLGSSAGGANTGLTQFEVAGAVSLTGALVAAIARLVWGSRADAAAEAAYRSYDQGLRARLRIKLQAPKAVDAGSGAAVSN